MASSVMNLFKNIDQNFQYIVFLKYKYNSILFSFMKRL
jgi:hypothetical protein